MRKTSMRIWPGSWSPRQTTARIVAGRGACATSGIEAKRCGRCRHLQGGQSGPKCRNEKVPAKTLSVVLPGPRAGSGLTRSRRQTAGVGGVVVARVEVSLRRVVLVDQLDHVAVVGCLLSGHRRRPGRLLGCAATHSGCVVVRSKTPHARSEGHRARSVGLNRTTGQAKRNKTAPGVNMLPSGH